MQSNTFYQIRRELHQHPELSGHEAQTARFVEDKLQAFNPTKVIRHVGGHGLLVEYFFSEDCPNAVGTPVDQRTRTAPFSTGRRGW